jgi:YihY family inner membrane protein
MRNRIIGCHFAETVKPRIITDMKLIKNLTSSIDTFQQKHPAVAFPLAVNKRFGDDKVGKQAALITYYGFLSLFPLLLAFITVINLVAIGDPALQAKLSQQAFQYFPALGDDLRDNVQSVKTSGIALVVQLLILLYGARGVAITMQDAFNYVWHADKDHKPNLVRDNLRSFAIIFAIGTGVTAGTVLSYFINKVLDIGPLGAALLICVNLAVIIGLFLVVFRLGTSNRVKTSNLILGAVIAGVGLLIVQQFGGYIMAHELPKLRGTYGTFALTLGMLFWIYLQAQIIMYALVTTAVQAERDWPKKLFS